MLACPRLDLMLLTAPRPPCCLLLFPGSALAGTAGTHASTLVKDDTADMAAIGTETILRAFGQLRDRPECRVSVRAKFSGYRRKTSGGARRSRSRRFASSSVSTSVREHHDVLVRRSSGIRSNRPDAWKVFQTLLRRPSASPVVEHLANVAGLDDAEGRDGGEGGALPAIQLVGPLPLAARFRARAREAGPDAARTRQPGRLARRHVPHHRVIPS